MVHGADVIDVAIPVSGCTASTKKLTARAVDYHLLLQMRPSMIKRHLTIILKLGHLKLFENVVSSIKTKQKQYGIVPPKTVFIRMMMKYFLLSF
jgi:hypothetical protein